MCVSRLERSVCEGRLALGKIEIRAREGNLTANAPSTEIHRLSLEGLARRRIANDTVSANTLRSQRAAGVIAATRTYFRRADVLKALHAVSSNDAHQGFIDQHTSGLLSYWRGPAPEILSAERQARVLAAKNNRIRPEVVPEEIGSWAAARKCVNIFVLSVRMNSLIKWPDKIDDEWLELPVDSQVAKRLAGDFLLLRETTRRELADTHAKVRGFPGLGDLQADDYPNYQSLAAEIAKVRGIPRVFLDLHYYSPGGRVDSE